METFLSGTNLSTAKQAALSNFVLRVSDTRTRVVANPGGFRTDRMQGITRREAVRLLATVAAAALSATQTDMSFAIPQMASSATPRNPPPPTLAPGDPLSSERLALIETFKRESTGLEKQYESRAYKGDFAMPYRLFRPAAQGKLPLVLYLHGSGGLGNDNQKQLEFGNIFGTRVWLLPENQKKFPCFVVVPQTDRGWVRYDLSKDTQGPAKVLPGLGEGNRVALQLVTSLCRELSIDEHRIYVTGQSMGGAGVWNIIAHRPGLFAAAVICCGSRSTDDGTGAIGTPLWAFHGASDQTVPATVTRVRIAARRKAGGHPLYTEYAGVDHDVWQWACTEPELVNWVFAQRRAS
jgi:poly(3-hydroxybutyrate) depolymerase